VRFGDVSLVASTPLVQWNENVDTMCNMKFRMEQLEL
jgi:hypothetical protein